ncbi:MAG TPA: alkaline phosphatase family protein [Candidatus Dormibacteraeota bacterium]|nr:alkaline phosphatase family protein [Candidatus Dormibacteraeota bacterium]
MPPLCANALVLCALAACLTACDGNAIADHGRVVIFGIDGADWQVIEPLVARGRLPHFKRLIEEGATGTLQSMEPSASPSLWTTIATGVRPDRHGIHGFVVEGSGGPGDAAHGEEGRAEPAGRRDDVRPVTSTMRRAPAFWNILPRYGRKVGVVGWLVTWPAEPTNGYIVSSYLPYIYNWSTGRPLKGTIVSGIPKQTFPESLVDDLESDKVKPADLPAGTVRRFYDPDRVRSLPADDRECVEGFLWSLACDETYRRIGLRLFEKYPVDLFAIYFGGVDVSSHRFWKFAHPDAMDYGVRPDEAAALGGVIDAYYVYVDGLLGEYLDRIGPETTLVVLSDHGFKAVLFPGKPTTSGHHRMQGVLALYGRGVRRDTTIEGAGLLDVLPTLLRLLNVPIARDLEGKVLEQALDAGFSGAHPATWVDTYGAAEHGGAPDESDLDRNVLERLRSLGYIN